MAQRQILTIFVGSPGDVQAERKTLRAVIERINTHVARHVGLHLELRGWEDTLPGYSRPQELINDDVRRCDLFIGILWKRWGSPTGEFSSGFEEEFRLAEQLVDSGEAKDIWLFFRTISAEARQDPGPQLKSVLRFKEEITDKKTLLYRQFADESAWADDIYDCLVELVVRRAGDWEDRQPIVASSPETARTEQPIPQDVRNAMTSFVANSNANNELARTYLFSAARLSSRFVGNSTIPHHELHVIYRFGRQFELSESEQTLILRTLAFHEYAVGWVWLKDSEVVAKTLRQVAGGNGETSMRKGALGLLSAMDDSSLSEVAIAVLRSEGSDTLKTDAAAKLGMRGNDSDLETVQQLIKDGHLSASATKDAYRAMTSIAARGNSARLLEPEEERGFPLMPISALEQWLRRASAEHVKIIWEAADSDLVTTILRAAASKVPTALLRVQLLSNSEETAVRAAVELASRPGAELSELKDALKKTNPFKNWPDEEVLRRTALVALYRTQSEEFLRTECDIGGEPSAALEALCEADLISQEGLRTHLLDGFATFTAEVRKEQLWSAAAELPELKKQFEIFAANARETLCATAIGLLTGVPDDLALVRSLVDGFQGNQPDKTLESAVDWLRERLEPEDSERMINVAKNLRSEANWALSEKVVVAALDSAGDGRTEVAKKLLAIDEPGLLALVIQNVNGEPKSELATAASDLLAGSDSRSRIIAAKFIMESVSRDQLEERLAEYVLRPHYYYDVVRIWDRFLYGPSAISSSTN